MALNSTTFPIVDLHCDLLLYLAEHPKVSVREPAMGASLPYLESGGVKLQVLAIFTGVGPESTSLAYRQSQVFRKLINDGSFAEYAWGHPETILEKEKITAIAAIENAAGFCTEEDRLDIGFQQLEKIIDNTGRLLYITMTHHTENRFGGGNYSDKGLKADGEVLLDWMDRKQIAIDFSHTSDPLADDILNYIDKKGLEIPIIASHSNFRNIWDHPRNLRPETTKEIVKRNGLIGLNFLRAFIDNNNPETFYEHILYGLQNAPNAYCFGADFFHTPSHPDQTRTPFFYEGLENASAYPFILAALKDKGIDKETLEAISFQNVITYLQNLN